MSVRGLMTVPPVTLLAGATVMEAIRTMDRRNAGAVAVEREGKLCGIFTWRDLVKRVLIPARDVETTVLEAVMTTDVASLTGDAKYGDALRVSVENGYTYIPIVDDDRHVVGMLSLQKLLEHRIDDLVNELDSLASYEAADGPGGN